MYAILCTIVPITASPRHAPACIAMGSEPVNMRYHLEPDRTGQLTLSGKLDCLCSREWCIQRQSIRVQEQQDLLVFYSQQLNCTTYIVFPLLYLSKFPVLLPN